MRCLLGIAWLLCAAAGPVMSAGVIVRLVDGNAQAVSDAVVMLTPDSAVAVTATPKPSATYFIDQRHETFIPYVQLLRPGDKVVFRNSDSTRHHAYSFAPIKTFELVLRPGESSPPISMDKTGIVAVGCNIHDHMITYLFVSAVPAVAMSGQDGVATIENVEPGNYTARVWHPQLHPGHPEPSQALVIADDARDVRLNFTLSLIPDPHTSMDRGHLEY
ncbi:MAG: methylamine utilization protein [Rhodanobacter sp.]